MRDYNSKKILEINDVVFVLDDQRNLLKDSNDVMINWVYPEDFLKGPMYNVDIMKSINSQVRSQLYMLKTHLKEGDSFITNSGEILTNVLCNVVVPSIVTKYNEAMFNVKETLNTYSKDNNCRYLSFWFPDNNYYELLTNMIEYLPQVSSLRVIYLYVDKSQEKQLLRAIYKIKRSVLLSKLIMSFNRCLYWK